MPLILTGRLATVLARTGCVAEAIPGARTCQSLLSNARARSSEVKRVREALNIGPVRQVLERKGFIFREGQVAPACEDSAGSTGRVRVLQPIPLGVLLGRHTGFAGFEDVSPWRTSLRLPSGALRQVPAALGLGEDVYLTSPALTYVLMASHVGLGALAEFGMELCGRYAKAVGPFPNCTYDLDPALSFGELTAGLASLEGCQRDAAGANHAHPRGFPLARRALEAVLEGSRSPMESKLAALLALPVADGGYGFRGLELNKPIALPRQQQRIAGRRELVFDGFFARAQIAYEYDSRQFHAVEAAGQDELSDRLRLTAAHSLGIRVLTLTWDMFRDAGRFDAFCDALSQMLGMHRRPPSARTLKRREALRQDLGLARANAALGCVANSA